MSNIEFKPPRLTIEEYLDGESASEIRHEFIDGEVYAMVGSTDRHGIIAGNLFAALHGHLRSPCQVFISDMKVKLRIDHADIFYYPDVVVSCDPADRAPLWREKPVLIIEVESPSTARIDHQEKLAAYKTIPSLLEYAIVAQDARRAEIFRRAHGWTPEYVFADGATAFNSVDLTLSLSQIYRGVDFPPPAPSV